MEGFQCVALGPFGISGEYENVISGPTGPSGRVAYSRGSAAARLLEVRVLIPLMAWMSVC